MNPNVDEVLAEDLAEYAVGIFEAHGLYRMEDAIRRAAANMAETKDPPPNPDEIGRAYGLALRMIGGRFEAGGGVEIHRDGSRRESDRRIVDELMGKWSSR